MVENKSNSGQNDVEIMCKNLSNPDRSVRQAALKELAKIASKELDSATSSEDWFDATYLHIIKCYADRFEVCRSLAATIFNDFIVNAAGVNDSHVDYILPVLKRRIGQGAIVEESEELRLQLTEQLLIVVQVFSIERNDRDPLMRHYNDIIDVILKTLTDPYACVQRKSCEVITALAGATRAFSARAENLVDPLIALLCHRQSATRVIAIDTLGLVCLHIDNKNDKILKIITSISPLLMDQVPSVRRQCGYVGCRWLVELVDRYSFFERILPLVLCCLKDETADIRDEINSRFVDGGQKYYEENEMELQKLELIDGEFPCDDYLEKVSAIRPTLGCRALVQRSLRMVSIILNEMTDWKVEVRLHALKLLWQMVRHAEKAFTVKFLETLPVLSKCCQDDERCVVDEAKHVAKLMGRLLTYDEWIEQTLGQLEKLKPSLGLLRCVSFLFAGADERFKFGTGWRVAKAIADPSVCHSLDERYQSAILDIVEQLVDLHLANDDAEHDNRSMEEKHLFQILVKTSSLSNAQSTDALGQRGERLINKLCRSPANRMAFNAKYVGSIIDSIEDLDCEHSERSERILLLYGCIKLCRFQVEYFDSMKRAIRLVLSHSEVKAKIKILTATSIALLDWAKTMNFSTAEENENSLQEFVDEMVVPNLVWQPGRHAESVRVVVMQVLCSIGDVTSIEAGKIFRKLIPQLASLAENDCALTRAYAMRCISKCNQLPYDDYKQLLLVISNGLDDPCADIRAVAIQCMGKLELSSDCEQYGSNSHHSCIEFNLSRLILHLDDTHLAQRPLLLDALKQLAERHPKSFQEQIERLPQAYPYFDEIDSIRRTSGECIAD